MYNRFNGPDLIADNLVVSLLSAEVDDPLELPAGHIAHSDVVNFTTDDQIIESLHCLLQGSPIVPAVGLRNNNNILYYTTVEKFAICMPMAILGVCKEEKSFPMVLCVCLFFFLVGALS